MARTHFPMERINSAQERELGHARIAAERGIARAIGSTPAGVALVADLARRLETNRYDISSIMPGLKGSSGSRYGGRPKRDHAEYAKIHANSRLVFDRGVERYMAVLATNGNGSINWLAAGDHFADIGIMVKLITPEIATLDDMVNRNDAAAISISHSGYCVSQPTRQAGIFLQQARAEQCKYDDIRSRFVIANTALSLFYCERYYLNLYSIMDRDDVVQEAMFGLMHAAEMWDPGRGVKFATYATTWIKQFIRRHLDKTFVGNIAIPVWQAEQRRQCGKKYWAMLSRLGEEPTAEELSAEVGISAAQIQETFRAYRLQGPSLSDPIRLGGERAFEVASFLAADINIEHDTVERVSAEKTARTMLSVLTPIEERVIRARYGIDGTGEETLEEIGNKMGRSRERVRQIEAQALAKMKASKNGCPAKPAKPKRNKRERCVL